MTKAFFVVASCALLCLGACQKKDYTCRCQGGFGGGQTTIVSKSSKAKAKKACAAKNEANVIDGFYNCEID